MQYEILSRQKEKKMLYEGITGTTDKTGIWTVIYIKYFINVKFARYSNYTVVT